ncbi:sensor histidine kinase [Paenibacillus thalictri]|uniref:Sensor histidine kinase n=1 Tax=Paenibacillus thalictri TaxID=2527873 RepID=A0A4Q9DXF7_9BACL|nr:histidine kinase [Paenibacillus thalictri]TBL81814.1 sensor histidine kinase [Paenibacillus thalictri]
MRNLKIKQRLFLILFTEAVVIGLLGWLALHISFKIYDNQIYIETSDKLKLQSRAIDEKLRKADELSYSILANPGLQQSLKMMKQYPDSYESSRASRELQEKFLIRTPLQPYVGAVDIIDFYDNQYSIGQDAGVLDKNKIRQIKEMAVNKKGASFWGKPDKDSQTFFLMRELKESANVSMETLGYLIIRVDADKLVRSTTAEISNSETHLTIVADQTVIYPNDSLFQVGPDLPVDEENGYRIIADGSNEYLAAYLTSSYTGWLFINMIPYASIFHNISIMKVSLLFFYIVILLVMIYIGFRFARSITKPIENLTVKIAQVGKGRFELDQSGVSVSRDEVGRLNRDFDIMISRLDALIKENYIKQMMLKEAEYQALKAKINPHFLYNTLESVNWLATMNGQTEISIMVKALGDLLRSTVNNKEYVTIGEEIANLDKYIQIQTIRYEDRLDYRMEIPENLADIQIPNLILQPIVENSIQYGLENMPGICRIRVGAEESAKELVIFVNDNGPGMDPLYLHNPRDHQEGQTQSNGIGLRSIHERIRFIYGDEYGIVIDSTANEGTTVQIRIPYMRNGRVTHVQSAAG